MGSVALDSFRIEVPSVEHPRLLAAAIDEAERRGVRIGRVSQGSGAAMLTDAELSEMSELAHAHGIELFLFISPRNSFEPLVDPDRGDQLRGQEAFADALEDLRRCVAFRVDGVLVADIGLLAEAGARRREGLLDLQLKSSAALAPLNAAAAELFERLGATSINVAASSTLADLVAMRGRLQATTTLDVYVESPDGFGGGLRYRELGRMVAELAPVFLKCGLRNAPSLYPYGCHLEPAAEQTIREKVRRAQLILERIERSSGSKIEPAVAAG